MKHVDVEIMMGLPGSGKTHYTKEHENQRAGVYAVVLDELSDIRVCGQRRSMEELVRFGVDQHYRTVQTILLDGPFFTNQHLRIALHAVAQEYGTVTVTIHHWLEDRETCLKNDGGRREVPSSATIQTARYEQPDVDWLNEQLAENGVHVVKVVTHKVQLKPDWLRYWKPLQWHEDGKLYSMSWCTGGYRNDCWGGSSPAFVEEPYNFDELDALLEKIAPQLTFLQYKRIHSTCVSTETQSQSDYYGGVVHRCCWVCDLEKLYTILHEYGYANV